MHKSILPLLCCPLSGWPFQLKEIRLSESDNAEIQEGVLICEQGTMFPVLDGIPRLLPDAMLEFGAFLKLHVPDFEERKAKVMSRYAVEIRSAYRRNRKTRNSFSREWQGHDYTNGKTWNLDLQDQVQQFFRETQESDESLKGKLLLDAGCGNGHLAMELAARGCSVIAMDFSSSVRLAAAHNRSENCHFIQADVAFPPFRKEQFHVIQSSGVLIHTPDTRKSFQVLSSFVTGGGKISIWVYRKRSEFIHKIFNRLRVLTSGMPAVIQIPFLRLFIYYPALLIKRLKGNPQIASSLWVEVLDWFTPEFRWEHTEDEVKNWFHACGFRQVEVSDGNHWGFNITGRKPERAG